MNIKIQFKVEFSKNAGSEECDKFVKLAIETIGRMESIKRCSTISNYKTAVNSFSVYMEKQRIGNNRITKDTISGYESWLLSRNICPNTVANYIRNLRALYNMVHDSGNDSPFSCVSTSNKVTSKRCLSIEDIRKLIAIHKTLKPSLKCYLDVFLFSVYTFGIPFVDLVQLKHSDITGDVITYNRRKTGKPVIIVLLPEAAQIAEKYKRNGKEYIFPFMEDRISTSYQKYQQQLARYNRALYAISQMAKINIKITSYVARHTWANLAFANGVDVGIISQALGHTNLRTTQIYLQELNAERMRLAGLKVLSIL